MASGSNYDLVAIGKADATLTGNANTTYWKSTHKRHTRFATSSETQPFNTQAHWGGEAQIILNRVGDMVYFLYLHVVLPGIIACDSNTENCAGLAPGGQFPTVTDGSSACAPCARMDEAALIEYLPSDYNSLKESEKADALKEAKDVWRRDKYGAGRELGCCADDGVDCVDQMCPELGDTWCHYTNDVGHFMISKAKLLIGGQEIDKLWGTFLFAWEELTGKSGRRLNELTMRRYTRGQLVCDSREEHHLYIPLPFYFTLASGSALPLASLAYHGVQINVEFERLEKLIVVSGNHVAVRNARTGLGINANDLKVDMEITYVYLDQQERSAFQSKSFEQLCVQTQQYFKTESKSICRIPLSMNHPTLELIFGVRRACNERGNAWSNLSGVDGRDPITHAELLLNTSSRFGKKPALYWRGVVPYERHSNLPEAFIYTMAFALAPEDSLNPSGSCNLSRIDNVELVLDMAPGLENESYTVFVYGRSWNIVRYREGVGGVAYA